MKKKQLQGLQAELEQIPTEELDKMLHAQLQEDTSDPDAITAILAVLQDREKDMPLTLTKNEIAAWQKFLSRRESRSAKPVRWYAWALRAACIVAILSVCLMAFSSRADANGFWNRIARWTDSVIEFFSPENAGGLKQEYEFQTDHPGLQQVYDTVTRLGVKRPVVPMWIPEGYELVQCEEMIATKKATLMVGFRNDNKRITYNLDVFYSNVLNQYQKDDTGVKVVEIEGIAHRVAKNHDMWVAVWIVDNIECSISVDCQEEEFYRILHSIYDKEETV